MQITKNTKLLVISPHPDDEALGVGGLIGKCKKEKASVTIFYVSVGTSRQYVTKKTELTSRMDEINNVKKFAKVTAIVGYTGDEFCRLDTLPQKELIEKIEDVIEKEKPTLVAIPSSSSYNQDHRAVFDACITALRPLPKTIRHFVPTVLEYYEPYFWSLREPKIPNIFLNLKEKYQKETLLDFKITLYKCHKTQVRREPFPRSPENLARLAHIYGKEIGVEIAEAYHLLRNEIW
jgi:LmbE family N-acetylglucosaminyl deacetylase